jgi:hypothetical protein
MSDGRPFPPPRAFLCPHCERPASAVTKGVALWDGWEGEDPVNPPVQWRLVQCDRCDQPTLEIREDYGEGFDVDEPGIIYPAPRRLSNNVPSGLRREYAEAQICLGAKAYAACVVMVRRTLEGACAELGIKKRNLAQALVELQKQGMIDGDLLEWANALRVAGNMGAHYTGETVTRQDAEDSLAFAEALLDHIYVLRRRFDEFKQRLARDAPSAGPAH